MKKTFALFMLTIWISLLPMYSQEKDSNQKTLAKFIITDWTKNGKDETPSLVDENAYLVFYTNITTDELSMANFWQKSNSQSYGPIYSLKKTHLEGNAKKHEGDLLLFQWHYINTYDNKKGTAKVELLKIYKPQGVYFEMTIIPENLDVLIYKGYAEGSLNLTVYE